MARWKIADGKREGVEALLTNTGLSRKDIGEECRLNPNTIRRFLNGNPVRDESLQLLFGYLTFQQAINLSEEQVEEVTKSIKKYGDKQPEKRRVRPIPAQQTVKAKPSNAASLASIVTVVKFVHLRDKRSGVPVYKRNVERLDGKVVEVYTEYFIVRTLSFQEVPEVLELHSSRLGGGVVDMQSVFPPRMTLVGNNTRDAFAEHVEHTPGSLSQAAVTILNGFQGNELVGTLVQEKCDRVILMVDMLSIPVKPGLSLHAAPPVAWLITHSGQADKKTQLACGQAANGTFLVDTAQPFGEPGTVEAWDAKRKLKSGDRVELWFSINWDALA